MTAEEAKAAESGAQPAPLRIEGVDISPKQDEGVLKVRAGGAGDPKAAGSHRAPRPLAAALPLSLEAPTVHRGCGAGNGRRCSRSRQSWSGRAATDGLQRLPGLGCIAREREGGSGPEGGGPGAWTSRAHFLAPLEARSRDSGPGPAAPTPA